MWVLFSIIDSYPCRDFFKIVIGLIIITHLAYTISNAFKDSHS